MRRWRHIDFDNFFIILFFDDFSIFTLQQKANATSRHIDYFAVLWYNINKEMVVRTATNYCFIGCFVPNNMIKGHDSVAVNDM